jgi:formylglycine-generating enzyme required for sulfatase activity
VRYRIIRKLGAGGMGAVFQAEQIDLGNRLVALKVLNRDFLEDDRFLMRFHDEGISTARIQHPNVVTIYESGQASDGPYIAMEYLEGEPLRTTLRRRGSLPVTECADILQQTSRGLNAAHKLGIIHRDLKPDNIFLTHGDEGELIVKVVDFGIAKLRDSVTRTLPGTVLGTPAYMSFEQASCLPSADLDARSDIYSLGVVTYEMLTGRVPFHSDTPIGYIAKHKFEPPPPFQTIAPGLHVSAGVEATVMKALAKHREERYGRVLDFARDFREAALAPEPAIGGQGGEQVRTNPKDGLAYVWIPPGTFMMGCSPRDTQCYDNENPCHPVTLTRGFWLGQTPVTVAAFTQYAAATGKEMPAPPRFNPNWSNGQMPIVNVTWEQARDYCRWAGGRLPTEAEWEHAARAGSSEPRYGHIDAVAWHKGNADDRAHEVAENAANGFGLFDMLGNVWEWVNDWYGENYYRETPPQDPHGPKRGDLRVLRGGSYHTDEALARASFRFGCLPDITNPNVGFRCVADLSS